MRLVGLPDISVKTNPVVALMHDYDDPLLALEEALDAVEIEGIVRGKYVVVKPNDTAGFKEAVTQPDTLRTVLQYLKSLNPSRLVVSGGSAGSRSDRVYAATGLMYIIEDEEVEYRDHNQGPFAVAKLGYGPMKEVVVNEQLFEHDTLISLAQHKVHDMATVTLTMENIAMSFPAADVYGYSQTENYPKTNNILDDLHGFIVGMIEKFPIHLGIIMGHPTMVGTGPLSGRTYETGFAIASKDCVACDTIGAALFGFSSHAVRHILEAGRRGLGQYNKECIEIRGLSLPEAEKRFMQKVYGREMVLAEV